MGELEPCFQVIHSLSHCRYCPNSHTTTPHCMCGSNSCFHVFHAHYPIVAIASTVSHTTVSSFSRSLTGSLEKLALSLVAIPTILVSFLFWTAVVLVGVLAAGMVLLAAGGSGMGYCFWTVRGEPFALHDLTIECPDIL